MENTIERIETTVETKQPKTVTVSKIRTGQAVRQGDVIAKKEKTLPNNLTPRNNKILSAGIRGSHSVSEPATLFDAINGDIWISSPAPFTLLHDEHHCINMPKGTYKSWIQVEYPMEQKESSYNTEAPRTIRNPQPRRVQD